MNLAADPRFDPMLRIARLRAGLDMGDPFVVSLVIGGGGDAVDDAGLSGGFVALGVSFGRMMRMCL